MRILMIAGVAGKAEAGGAGVVYNVTKELRNLGHTVKIMFFEDVLPKQRWPARFRTVEFARAVAKYAGQVKSEYDIINIYAPFGFSYGFARRRRGTAAGPPYVLTMHGIEERRNYAMATTSTWESACPRWLQIIFRPASRSYCNPKTACSASASTPSPEPKTAT